MRVNLEKSDEFLPNIGTHICCQIRQKTIESNSLITELHFTFLLKKLEVLRSTPVHIL